MTAAEKQTVRVYIGDFSKCGSRTAFYRTAIRTFGMKNTVLPINRKEFFTELCRRLSAVSSGFIPVRIRLSGLESAYVSCPDEVTTLIRILRAIEENSPLLRTEIRIGNAIWNVSR